MKIYNVTFCNDNGRNHDSITVTTLKEIDFPRNSISMVNPDLEVLVRKFLEDAFDAYLRENLEDDLEFHHFSEIEFINVFEMNYPLI